MSLGSQWYKQDVRVLFQTTGFTYFQMILLNIAACCCGSLSISSELFSSEFTCLLWRSFNEVLGKFNN